MEHKKKPTIAVVVGEDRTEYLEDLAKGFRFCAKEEDINLIFVQEAKTPKESSEIFSAEFDDLHCFQYHQIHDYMRFIQPDVIILAYGSMVGFRYVKEKQDYWQRYEGIPCVMIEGISEHPDIPSLVSDNYGGMRKIMEHLTDQHGYEHICFLAGPKNNYDSNERLRAYRDVMAEHDLPVTADMVVYGDYSRRVEHLADALLDSHPDMEALVCANDDMARAVYRVCERRELVVGQDLAVTGYDNSRISLRLEPPLTTVSHDAAMYAYAAIQAALRLYEGGTVPSQTVDTLLCVRGSCGCNQSFSYMDRGRVDHAHLRLFLKERLHGITDEIFGEVPYEALKVQCYDQLAGMIDYIMTNILEEPEAELSRERISRYVRKLYQIPFMQWKILIGRTSTLLQEMLAVCPGSVEKEKLFYAISVFHDYVYSKVAMEMHVRNDKATQRSWFLTSFTRDLLTAGFSYEENMTYILKRLQAMEIPGAYFFFFHEDVRMRPQQTRIAYPQQLYLSAYYHGDRMVVYPFGEGVIFPGIGGISSVIPQDQGRIYTAYNIFSGDRQYGMMLCENEEEDNDFLLECSLQLGNLFLHLNLQDTQQASKEALQQTLSRMEEQNRVLNFVSKKDALTQLLNRRGFMEDAIAMLSSHPGQLAALFFADLNHLKEINDCFGHQAGDLAIRKGAEYLNDCLPRDAVTARIGGDEYIALVVIEKESQVQQGFSQGVIALLRKYMDEFNDNSDLPYMVEFSMGACEFICGEDTNIEALIGLSDEIMYREKQKRRASIKKLA
jgi:diguanylate cyclase (GGDEF)-like protein